MNYTIGNWTVESVVTDSISATKNVAIADLDFAKDFARSVSSDTEATMVNTTGASVTSPEVLRYARSRVQNVYNGMDIPAINMFANKGGYRTLAEVKFCLKAVNSVSGQEVLLPFKGWTCLVIPDAAPVTEAAVDYALKRTIAAAFDTGSVNGDRITEAVRGALIPA
jgi:hypothetical protein